MKHLEKIIEGCVSGKSESQSKLYRLYSKKLFGISLYYSKDYTEAEDILQDSFIKIFRNVKQFNATGSFEAWMRRIVVNTALEKFRKQNYLYSISEVNEYVEDFSYDDIISEISVKDLLKLIQELSPKYRMVFNLYAIEGFSHKEISKKLDISVGTSKSNLARARTILQDKVKKFYNSDIKNKMII